MKPFAHGLRDHELFSGPIAVDLDATIEMKVPTDPWVEKLGVSTVDVLPLVDDRDQQRMPGWCSYEATISDGPSVEIISGGINTKTPEAAGIWRQGHLMHFGFQESPGEMNDTGDAMLVNSIAYIARFTEDRPNVISPSPFAGEVCRPRSSLANILERYGTEWFVEAIAPELLETAPGQSQEELLAWFKEESVWMRPNGKGQLELDADAKSLGLRYDDPEFPRHAVTMLMDDNADQQDAIIRMLTRYIPCGPVDDASKWTEWVEAHADYLFFSEWAGYRWYVDELAKERGVPTKDLRGPARADLDRTAMR